jgi:hypothetical protein
MGSYLCDSTRNKQVNVSSVPPLFLADQQPCFAVKVSELSAYSFLGVNLIEPPRGQDSVKAWSVLQKDQYPQDRG